MPAQTDQHLHRGLTLRSFCIALVAMFTMGVWIEYEELYNTVGGPLAENSPPNSAVGVIVALLVICGLLYKLRSTLRLAVAELVAAGASRAVGVELGWDLVYQSRSGPPTIPWLDPDVSDHLDVLSSEGVSGAVLVPIGFISDHMEVVWDLDAEALAHARDLGLPCVRAATVGVAPEFVSGLVDLVVERLTDAPVHERPALSRWGPSYDVCPVDCCPNPRGERPALCGAVSVAQ